MPRRARARYDITAEDKTQKAVKSATANLKSFLKFATVPIAGIGGVAFAKSVAQTAEEVDLFSKRIGVNRAQLQTWQRVAERFNVANDALNVGLQRLTRRAAEAAQGTGEAKMALRELGIDAERFEQLTLDQKMLLLARAFDRVDREADRVRLAFKLFDTEGVGFLQFLNEGEEGLRKIRAELAQDVWSDATTETLANFNREWREFGTTLQLIGGTLIGPVISGVNTLIDKLREVTGFDDFMKFVRATGGLAGPGRDNEITIDQGRAPQFVLDDPRQEELARKNLDAVAREREKQRQAQEKEEAALQQVIADRELENLRRMNEARQRFVSTFTQNMIQASESGFDAVLESWKRTLQQMIFEQINSGLFDFLGGGKPGSAAGGLLGLLGFDSGGVVPGRRGAARLAVVHGGETILPTHKTGGMMPSITQNITFQGGGGGFDRAQLEEFGRTVRNETIAAMHEARRRGQ